jgi:hypothetical protein
MLIISAKSSCPLQKLTTPNMMHKKAGMLTLSTALSTTLGEATVVRRRRVLLWFRNSLLADIIDNLFLKKVLLKECHL